MWILDSCTRTVDDLAGVFEYDGETGYFYLYAAGGSSSKVLDAIHIASGKVDFKKRDIWVRWDAGEHKVGLFIRGTLWAVFDVVRRQKYGGDYAKGVEPLLAEDVTDSFKI